jgi:hypothetical protein
LPAPAIDPPSESEPVQDGPDSRNPAFAKIEDRLFSAIDELTRLSSGKLDAGKRLAIQSCAMIARDQLDLIALSTRV